MTTVLMQLADVQVAVFGGGSFGTAIGCALARQKPDLTVTLLLRDPQVPPATGHLHSVTGHLSTLHKQPMCLSSPNRADACECSMAVRAYCAAPCSCPLRAVFALPAWRSAMQGVLEDPALVVQLVVTDMSFSCRSAPT